MVLDESGYTAMWQADKSADAAGRLENLKELVRSMEEFDNLAGFLEHISLVMDREQGEGEQAVNIMTLHSAKGLEFDTVFLPGWEEGVFPNQRALDESGRAGLEEERRLAHVGLTRARKRARICFATNRRIHGLWTSTVPSRFLDELPEADVEVKEPAGGTGGFGMSGYGPSRFDEMSSFGSNYGTPGWQRAQGRKGKGGFDETGQRRYVADEDEDQDGPAAAEGFGGYRAPQARPGRRSAKRDGALTIEGELIAKSTGAESLFKVGERVFHQKFGNGNVTAVDGNKLTIAFDKAGEKRVVDSFVERV
jgi:DNA helicase-2/ATP-dependent DNA helicase PcrA